MGCALPVHLPFLILGGILGKLVLFDASDALLSRSLRRMPVDGGAEKDGRFLWRVRRHARLPHLYDIVSPWRKSKFVFLDALLAVEDVIRAVRRMLEPPFAVLDHPTLRTYGNLWEEKERKSGFFM